MGRPTLPAGDPNSQVAREWFPVRLGLSPVPHVKGAKRSYLL
jgi:hypothetical protein